MPDRGVRRMNIRTPDILSRLVGLADRMIREQDARELRPDAARGVELGQIEAELIVLLEEPIDDRGFDETAAMLAQCLMHLNCRGGALGDTEAATRWAKLAQSFVPFVRTDFAVTMVAALTSEHDFQRR